GLREGVDHRPGRVHRPRLRERDHARHLRGHALGAAARRPRRLPDAIVLSTPLPAAFPRDAKVVATDLDNTLLWHESGLRPRTRDALVRARGAGLHVIVATGRMVQSMQRVVPTGLLADPAVCYQGAVVVDAGGAWLRHETIELALARE